jgi:hypothetical protein
MRNITKEILSICIVIFGLSLLASPFLMSHAQKKSEVQGGNNQDQDEQVRQARQEVAKSVVGSIFLEAVAVKEPSWGLDKAGYVQRGAGSNFTYVNMSLKKDSDSIGISIREYDSFKDADAAFTAPRSYGSSVAFNKYGDKGEKIIGDSGDLMAIRFRKGNFFVSIFTKGDAKTAERFAGHLQKSLSDSGVK